MLADARMTIDKAALFEATRALWPHSVRVSDPNEAHEIYRALEHAFPQDDDWRQLALWSFHQALGGYEKCAIAKGLPRVDPCDVTFAEFDRWMRWNLNGDDCWLDRRAEYESA
ncbi:hypothetical protein [Sphingomonas sp. RS2018]